MAEDNAQVKKAASAESSTPVAAAEVETAPLQGGGEAPTALDVEADPAVSTEDTKEELKEEARTRGLDDSGTKQELVDRISEHDDKGAHKPEVLYAREED